MVGRGKPKQACSKGLSESLKEDCISQLPDPLISYILSHLSTSDAVRTSVLATRWRSLWLWVPSLELLYWNFRDSNALMSFGDKFFYSNRVSCIDNLMLAIENNASHLTSWIDVAVKRKIRHLDLYFRRNMYPFEIPISLYICETLVSLKLHLVALPNAEVVSLPCLKMMHLEYIRYPNDATFERLVSYCPVLEELRIRGRVNSDAKVFWVLSRSLKNLNIDHVVFPLHDSGLGFVIDAPQLHFQKAL